MEQVRWGIIGCGDVTEVKSGPGFARAANSSLHAVMRRTGDLARDYAARHGVPRWYDDADALIADAGVDAVYVATRPDTHREFALRCAAAGKPCLMEKPLGLNGAECAEMVDAFRTAGVPLWVAFYRRAMPLFLKVKELVDTGAIGAVRFATCLHHMKMPESGFDAGGIPWRFLPDVGAGGVFVDMGSHVIDFLDYLFGPIGDVDGFAANQAGLYPAEDFVSARFSFDAGIQATGTWCFTSYRDFEKVRIFGTLGEVAFSCFAPEPVELTTADGTRSFDIGHPAHVHQPLIQTVVDELTGRGTCPSTGDSAMRATRVVDAVLEGYRRRGEDRPS